MPPRRRKKQRDVLAMPVYDSSVVQTRPADSSWVAEFLAGYELDRNVGFAVRQLFRNHYYLPSSPYKMVLHILRGKEFIRQLPPPEQYSDVQVDTRMPRNTNEEPLIQVAALRPKSENVVMDQDVRAGGNKVSGSMFTWGKAGLAFRHLAKLVGVDPAKGKDKPEERAESWRGPFETPVRTAFHVLTLIRTELGNMPSEVTLRDKTMATFIETVHVDDVLDPGLAVPIIHKMDNTVEVVVAGGRLDDALLILIKRIAEEGHQADVSTKLGGVSLEVVLELQGGHDRRTVSFQMDDMRTKRQQVVAILKSAVIDGGAIALKFLLSLKRVLPSCLVGMATDAPHQMLASNQGAGKDPLQIVGGSEEEGDDVSRAQPVYSEGFMSITRRYKFTWKDTSQVKDRRGNSAGAKDTVRCFNKLPFESFATGIFFDHKDAELYRRSYSKHMLSMKSKDGSGRDLMVNDMVRHLSSEAVKHMDAGRPAEAARLMIQILAVFTPTRTSSTYSLRQCSAMLRGMCGIVGTILGVTTTLRLTVKLLRGFLGRANFNVGMCNLSLRKARAMAAEEASGSVASAGGAKKEKLSTPEEREMHKIATLMLTLQGSVVEYRSLIQNLVARSTDSSELFAQVESLMQHLQPLFDPKAIYFHGNWPDGELSSVALHAWRRELVEVSNGLKTMQYMLTAVHDSMAFDILLELIRVDEDMWDRRKAVPPPTVMEVFFGSERSDHKKKVAMRDAITRTKDAAMDLLLEQSYLGPGRRSGDPKLEEDDPEALKIAARKKPRQKDDTSVEIPPGLFEDGYSLKSVYEPPLTFTDTLSFIYAWHLGLMSYGRLVFDANTKLFITRSLTVSKEDEDDRRAAGDQDKSDARVSAHVWEELGVPSEEASIRGLPELAYTLPLQTQAVDRQQSGSRAEPPRMTLEHMEIDADEAGRGKVKFKASVIHARNQWASAWVQHSALGTHWLGRQGGVPVMTCHEEEMKRGDSSTSAAFDMVKIRYLHETRLTQALEEGYFSLATMPQRRNPYAQLCFDLQRFPSLFYLWRFSDTAVAARLGGLWHTAVGEAAPPSSAVRPASIMTPKNVQGASRIAFLLDRRMSSLPHKSKVDRLGELGDPDAELDREEGDVLAGGLLGPLGLLQAIGDWSEVLRVAWTLPPLFSNVQQIVPHALATTLAQAPNSKNRFSNLDRNALKTMRLSVHCGLSYETARRFGRPALERDLQQGAMAPRRSSTKATSPPLLHVQSQDPDLGTVKGSYTKLRLEMVVRVDIPHTLTGSAMEHAFVDASREVFADTLEACLRHMGSSVQWVPLRLSTPAGKRFNSKLDRLGTERQLVSEIREACALTGECLLECVVNMPVEGPTAMGDEGTPLTYEKLSDILHAGLNDGEDPTAHDGARIVAGKLAVQRIENLFRQAGVAGTYQSVQVAFTLMVVQTRPPTAGKKSKKEKVEQRDYNSHYPGSAARSQLRLLARGANALQNLAVGRDDTMARLVASTVYLSPAAARAVWGVVGGPAGVDRCIRYEAMRSWRGMTSVAKLGPHRFVDAYDRGWLALALTSPFGPSTGSPLAKFGPQLCRMDISIARKIEGVLAASATARELLARTSGANAMSMDTSGLGMLLTRNVCLAARMCIQSPQAVALRGGCVRILKLLEKTEELLGLGRYRLIEAHKAPSHALPSPGTSVTATQFSERVLMGGEMDGLVGLTSEQNPDFPTTRRGGQSGSGGTNASAASAARAGDSQSDDPESALRKRLAEYEACREASLALEEVEVMLRCLATACALDIHRNIAHEAAPERSMEALLAALPAEDEGPDIKVGGEGGSMRDAADLQEDEDFHDSAAAMATDLSRDIEPQLGDGVDDGTAIGPRSLGSTPQATARHESKTHSPRPGQDNEGKGDAEYHQPVRFSRNRASLGDENESDLFAGRRERQKERKEALTAAQSLGELSDFEYDPSSGVARMKAGLIAIAAHQAAKKQDAAVKRRGYKFGKDKNEGGLGIATAAKMGKLAKGADGEEGKNKADASEGSQKHTSAALSPSNSLKSMSMTDASGVSVAAVPTPAPPLTVKPTEPRPQLQPTTVVTASASAGAGAGAATVHTAEAAKPKGKWGKLKLGLDLSSVKEGAQDGSHK